MSAYRYLEFVIGIVIVAVLGAVVNEFVLPIIDTTDAYSTTPESSTGLTWYSEFWDWMPLWVSLLLAFMFIVGIVLRRRATLG